MFKTYLNGFFFKPESLIPQLRICATNYLFYFKTFFKLNLGGNDSMGDRLFDEKKTRNRYDLKMMQFRFNQR